MQEPATNNPHGKSDRANVLVMIFGFVVMLAALWVANVLFVNHDDDGPQATVHTVHVQSQ